MQTMNKKKEEKLLNARHAIGLYSIKELCVMFGCSRYNIDKAINNKKLKYMSPNNRDRYICIDEFIHFMKDSNVQS